MTEGKPGKILWRFALPVLCSVAFQQMYQIADSVIAGRCVGGSALAAIGASYPVTMLFMAVATGLNLGCSVAVSQLFGAKDYSRMKTAVSTSILSTLAISLVLMAAGLLFCEGMLGALGTDAYIFDDAALYLRIYLYGMAFLFLYNICTGIFNALGDSRTPLYLLIGSSVGNVILDYVLVTAFDMGVAGVAWATFLAQGVSSILATLTLMRRIRKLETDEPVQRFNRSLLPIMAGVAVPSICQQSFVSIGIFLVQGIINDLGSVTVAAFAAALKISTFACVLINTLPTALTSFASQNIGAGRLDRAREGLKYSIWIAEALIVVINAAFFLFGDHLVGAFVSGSYQAEVIVQGTLFLHIVAPFYTLIGVKNSCDSVLRGGGVMGQFMATTFADLALRVIFSYVFARTLGFYSICLAYPFGWIFGTLLSVVYYKMGRW
ncbi:MAG: MATE family efflux transporter, partial [Butyricicoccus sp.]|nr:MATE family efflux transporter [Butyricicoccus sp.]